MPISISILLTCVIVGVGGALRIWARWRDGRSALAAEAAESVETAASDEAVVEDPCVCGHAQASHTLQRLWRTYTNKGDWACVDCMTPADCNGRYRRAPGPRCVCGHDLAGHTARGCKPTCECHEALDISDVTAAGLLQRATQRRLRQLHCACGHVVSYHGDDGKGDDGKCGAFAACRCVAPAPPTEDVNAARRLALRDLAWCCAVGTCDAATCSAQDFCVYTFCVYTGPRPWIVVPKAEIRAVVAAALVEFGGSILCQICGAQPDRACCWAVHGKHVSPKSETVAAETKQAWLATLGADAAGDHPDPICPNGYTYSRVWLADRWDSDQRPVCDGPCLCGLYCAALYIPQAKAE